MSLPLPDDLRFRPGDVPFVTGFYSADVAAYNRALHDAREARRMSGADRVEKHYRDALQGEIERLEADVNELLEKLKEADAGRLAAELESGRAWSELEATQDALVEAEEKMEGFSEAETVTYALSPRERLELARLEHRHNLLADRLDSKLGPAIKDAARANHRSRWLLGLVWAIFASLALLAATYHQELGL